MPDPQIFKPYIVTSVTNTAVELKLSKSRTYAMVFLLRILPLLLFAFTCFIGYGLNNFPIGVKWTYPASGLILCILLWSRKIITSVSINQYSVNANFIQFFQSASRDVSWNEVDHIQLRVKHGRDGGAFYKLVFTDGKKFSIMKIPVWYLQEENIQQINQFLQTVSGKNVTRKNRFF